MELIRVCVTDDHALFRRGLKAVIVASEELEFGGEAANGIEAIRLAEEAHADIMLMDIQMPEMNGIDATRQILDKQPDIGIIMLTMIEDDDAVFAALRAGARGYLLKGASQDELVRAIKAVANGEALFGAPIAERMMAYFTVDRASMAKTAAEDALPELTPREIEVLELIARGLKNPQIAEELVISPKTLRNHISSIFSKLHVTDRHNAIEIARDAGLGDED